MKTLYIVRHAKSSWKDKSLMDWQRPLNKRGERDAPKMGVRLATAGASIDKIISSTAVRAKRTAELLAQALNFYTTIDFSKTLYHADATALVRIIASVDDSVNSLMIIAHNPGITEVVNRFSGYPIENVPTCGIAVFRYDMGSWTDIERHRPLNVDLDYPKKK